MASRGLSFDALPRPLRWLAIAAAAVLFTSAFAILRFPYERVATAISDESEALVGVRLVIAELGPSLWPGQMGLVAGDVRAVLPRGDAVLLERVRVRPAASLSWLLASPTLYIELGGGAFGTIEGELTLGSRAGFDGRLAAVDLAQLPLEQLAAGLAMDGRVNGTIAVTSDPDGNPAGRVEFAAAEGSLSAAGMPIGIPFASFIGDLMLGGDHFARIDTLELRGPMADADATGTIGRAPQRGTEPLDLTLDLQTRGSGLGPILKQLGVRTGAGGRAKLKITGTLSRPTFR